MERSAKWQLSLGGHSHQLELSCCSWVVEPFIRMSQPCQSPIAGLDGGCVVGLPDLKDLVIVLSNQATSHSRRALLVTEKAGFVVNEKAGACQRWMELGRIPPDGTARPQRGMHGPGGLEGQSLRIIGNTR